MAHRAVWLAAVVSLASSGAFVACVSDTQVTPDAGVDGSVEASADVAVADVVDAAVSDARCNPNKPFGTIEAVPELNTSADDFGAFLTDNELTVYWVSNSQSDAGVKVRTATRATPTAAFPAGAIVPDLTGPSGTNSLHLSPDTKTAAVIYVGSWTIQLGTRGTTTGPFTGFVPLTALNGGFNYALTMRADGAEIFFGSPRNGKTQIFTSTGSGSSFATPTVFNQAASASAEDGPVLSRDAASLYFSSDRPGTAGSHDIWVSKRSGSGPFQTPARITELGTGVAEVPSWVSPDECSIYFSRGPVAQRDIYRAMRPK